MNHSRPLSELSDYAILAKVGTLETDPAFEEIFSRHSSMVFATAMRITGNVHDAEDVVQAVFLVLLKKAHSLRGPISIGGWLYRVATLLARKARARVARQEKRKFEYAIESRSLSSPSALREVLRILDEELIRIAEPLQSALVLCYLEHRTYDQAAAALGVTPATIKHRLIQGKEKLKRRLVRRGVTITATTLAGILATQGENAAAHMTPPVSQCILASLAAPERLGFFQQVWNMCLQIPLIYRATSFAAGVAVTVGLVAMGSSAVPVHTEDVPLKATQPADSPAAPEATSSPEAVDNPPSLTAREKAKKLKIPESAIQFTQKPIEEAFALVEAEFRKVDPEGTGVRIVVVPGFQPSKARISNIPLTSPGFNPSKGSYNDVVSRFSLEDAVRKLADHNNLRYAWKGDVILVGDFQEKEIWAKTSVDDTVKTILLNKQYWFHAALDGRAEIAQRLLDAGFTPNQTSAPSHVAPLDYAVYFGRTGIVRLLLTNGARVNEHRAGGFDHYKSYLTSAAAKGFTDLVEVLLNAGADLHYESDQGVSALEAAIENGHTATARFLIARGAKANPQDLEKLTKADQKLIGNSFFKQDLTRLSADQLLSGLIQAIESSPQQRLDTDSIQAALSALKSRGEEGERKIGAFLKTGADRNLLNENSVWYQFNECTPDKAYSRLRTALLNTLWKNRSTLAEEINLSIVKGAGNPAGYPDGEEFRIAVRNLEESWPGRHRELILSAVEKFLTASKPKARPDYRQIDTALHTAALYQASDLVPEAQKYLMQDGQWYLKIDFQNLMKYLPAFPEEVQLKALQELAAAPVAETSVRDREFSDSMMGAHFDLSLPGLRAFVRGVYLEKMTDSQRKNFVEWSEAPPKDLRGKFVELSDERRQAIRSFVQEVTSSP